MICFVCMAILLRNLCHEYRELYLLMIIILLSLSTLLLICMYDEMILILGIPVGIVYNNAQRNYLKQVKYEEIVDGRF